jgi:siroheme synthase-like protein
MFPVALNVALLSVAIVGDSPALARRLRLLDEAGAGENVTIFSTDPCKELQERAGKRWQKKWPKIKELEGAALILGADLLPEQEVLLAQMARKVKALLNIEDRREYCDFFYSSTVRRGDLLLAINTNGKSPALSVRIRRYLEEIFPQEWSQRLEELAVLRLSWKKEGASFKEVLNRSNTKIDEWIKDPESSISNGSQKENG